MLDVGEVAQEQQPDEHRRASASRSRRRQGAATVADATATTAKRPADSPAVSAVERSTAHTQPVVASTATSARVTAPHRAGR